MDISQSLLFVYLFVSVVFGCVRMVTLFRSNSDKMNPTTSFTKSCVGWTMFVFGCALIAFAVSFTWPCFLFGTLAMELATKI